MVAMMSLATAASAMEAIFAGPDATFTGVTTDTRGLNLGELYFAIRGERFDGAAFVTDALARGASAAVVEQDSLKTAGAPRERLLLVEDARHALGRLAAFWRARFSEPVLALTGSNGKTTVKEMCASILAVHAGGAKRVLATTGNLNNDIGVPLTLLRLAPDHRYAVIELGMNHAGEIRYLSHLARPDVALVTNAGVAHLENLGSRGAIARAKGEIFEGLKDDGSAVINADDQFASMWRDIAGARKQVSFGLHSGPDVSGRCELTGGGSVLDLVTPVGDGRVELAVPGTHNVRNALAAAAAAIAIGVGLPAIIAGLASYHGVKGRLQFKSGARGAQIIDDTYNANPDSVKEAIAVLAAIPGRRFLVLGDMGELGSEGADLHAEIGGHARAAGINGLFTLGELSERATRAYGTGARHFTSVEDLVRAIGLELESGVTVLVKGSRFMRMERVVALLAADTPGISAVGA